MPKPVRRTRSPHRGVVLLKPRPELNHPTWRARYTDPDTGKKRDVALEPLAARTAESRRAWAVAKSKALQRRMDLDAGALPTTGTALGAALARYFEDHPQIRERTRLVYRRAADKLEAWAVRAGVRSADDLTGPRLVAFRASLVKAPLPAMVKGGKRGQRAAVERQRAPNTVNRELRSIGTVLGYLRRLGLLPRLSGDDLRDGLKKLPVVVEQVDYLQPADLRALFEACLRHDAERFAATRDEHAGLRPPGSTARFEPVAPFVAFVLLTGMRFSEALEVEWSQVNLDALDRDGARVGEIRLSAASTKTKRGRTVGLEVSPGLVTLLEALRPEKPTGKVFEATADAYRAAERRLRRDFEAPAAFGWQALRRTCGTFLTNAPGIFGASSAYRSAKQLGHSVAVAERHYLDVARGIPREARTLDAAMQIEAELARIVAAVPEAAQSAA